MLILSSRIGTEIMEYLNHRRLIEGQDIVPMGQLIKIMLMGHDCGPLQQVQRLHYRAQDESSHLIANYEGRNDVHDKRVFCVQGSFLGFIASTGPSTRDVVANMDAVSTWHKALLRNFPDDLGPATFESNKLMRAILDSTHETVDNYCLSHVSCVQWRPSIEEYPKRNVIYDDIKWCRVQGLQNLQATRGESNNTQLIQLMAAQDTRLRRKMGFASPEARPGDLIYLIPGVEHCVTVRLTGGTMDSPLSNLRMQICGTSRLPLVDIAGQIELQSLQGQRSRDVYENHSLVKSLEIKMDARTLFILLS